MHYTFQRMSQQVALTIAAWHYPPPYDFYDADRDPEDLAELLDPESRGDAYYSVWNEDNELIGFFVFKCEKNNTVEIGLGLRPDLTGKGYGADFLQAGLDFARKNFLPTQFRLSVALFNTRAMRVYERAGFVACKTFMNRSNGGEYEFLQMIKSISFTHRGKRTTNGHSHSTDRIHG